MKNPTLFIFGLILIAIGFAADYLGLGNVAGIGATQTAVMILGGALSVIALAPRQAPPGQG